MAIYRSMGSRRLGATSVVVAVVAAPLVRDDIEGAKGVGMQAVLIDRKEGITALTGKIPPEPGCPRIASLSELSGLLFAG